MSFSQFFRHKLNKSKYEKKKNIRPQNGMFRDQTNRNCESGNIYIPPLQLHGSKPIVTIGDGMTSYCHTVTIIL